MFCTGRAAIRVYPQREYERETYIRALLFFTSYLGGRCLLSSAKGASLRCRKEREFRGKRKETGAVSLKG